MTEIRKYKIERLRGTLHDLGDIVVWNDFLLSCKYNETSFQTDMLFSDLKGIIFDEIRNTMPNRGDESKIKWVGKNSTKIQCRNGVGERMRMNQIMEIRAGLGSAVS